MSDLGAICSKNMVSCGDTKCIPLSSVCNGIKDCADDSDEESGCTGSKFQIHGHYV